jgi:3-carboxy-cis,cis-muconate cycloisomerase
VSDVLCPGDERAGALFTGPALLAAMVRVEAAWLSALVSAGIADAGSADDLSGLIAEDDVYAVAAGAESGGNPVIPLLAVLRGRLEARNPDAATWIHRGLTSQDVLDTALMLCVRDALDRLRGELSAQTAALVELAGTHRDTPMVGRTLTQHAVPITFGLKAAGWLTGVLDAVDDLDALELPAQFGGAAGTLAAPTLLAECAGLTDPSARAIDLTEHAARSLGLRARLPWHTARAPVTRIGDGLVRCCDAFGHIAGDVLTLSRPEIGELAEPTAAGRGGSSSMPHKANPVLSVLIRRAALAAPHSVAQLHLAAADSRDERPDAAWHLEWPVLRTLCRCTVVTASQTTDLVTGLRVLPDRMRATLEASGSDLLAERRALETLPGRAADPDYDPLGYLGATKLIINAALARARTRSEKT